MIKKIAVVIPVYRAEKIVDELCNRLITNLSELTDAFEIILITEYQISFYKYSK